MNKQALTVILFSIYCVIFGSVRFFLEGDAWGFLHHNLWLASIPLLIAGVVVWRKWTGWRLAACWFAWLIFLPNAPYIVTDLIHLRGISTLPWFDLVLIFHFALAGLLVGALSLRWMSVEVRRRWAAGPTAALTGVVFLLCGFGMVLGRDLRLKSEHLFIQPLQTLTDALQAIDETSLTKSLVYAALFATFYLVFQGIGTGGIGTRASETSLSSD